ncbi:MAG: hypothetical protein ACP5LH_03500 [Candidatus Micrarchaeia archaeon]
MGTPIIDDLKDAFDVIIHPTTYSYKTMGVGESIIKFYKVMLIPMILLMILSAIFISSVSSAGGLLGAAAGAVATGAFLFGILIDYIVIIPIGLIISAAVLQLIAGSLLKWYNKGFNATLSGLVYGIFPALLLNWLSPIPILGTVIAIIVFFWVIVVESLSLGKLHNISALKAFGGLLITTIIIFVIIIIIALIVGMAFLGALTGSLGGASLAHLGSNSSAI